MSLGHLLRPPVRLLDVDVHIVHISIQERLRTVGLVHLCSMLSRDGRYHA